MEYYIYGTGTLIALLGPHDKFFISDFGIWIGDFFQMEDVDQSVC